MKHLVLLVSLLAWGYVAFAQHNYVSTSPISATPGSGNTIIGIGAGKSTTTGRGNLMVGNEAGASARTARDNVYLGNNAAPGDTTLNDGESVYIGNEVALNMKRGTNSVIVGFRAGQSLLRVDDSVIIGFAAGGNIKGSSSNTMIGDNAGASYIGVQNMVCIGQLSGTGRTFPQPVSGNDGTYVGFEAGGADGLSNATAIGARAFVAQSGSLILGHKDVLVGIGNSAPRNKLEITTTAANQSGLRFTNLTVSAPATVSNGKVLSVNKEGDVILTQAPDLSALLTRLTALEQANSNQKKQIEALTKRVTALEKQVNPTGRKPSPSYR